MVPACGGRTSFSPRPRTSDLVRRFRHSDHCVAAVTLGGDDGDWIGRDRGDFTGVAAAAFYGKNAPESTSPISARTFDGLNPAFEQLLGRIDSSRRI
jgi:hypothetical protein